MRGSELSSHNPVKPTVSAKGAKLIQDLIKFSLSEDHNWTNVKQKEENKKERMQSKVHNKEGIMLNIIDKLTIWGYSRENASLPPCMLSFLLALDVTESVTVCAAHAENREKSALTSRWQALCHCIYPKILMKSCKLAAFPTVKEPTVLLDCCLKYKFYRARYYKIPTFLNSFVQETPLYVFIKLVPVLLALPGGWIWKYFLLY